MNIGKIPTETIEIEPYLKPRARLNATRVIGITNVIHLPKMKDSFPEIIDIINPSYLTMTDVNKSGNFFRATSILYT